MTLAGAVVFVAIFPWVAWDEVYSVSTPLARAEASIATAVLAACWLATMALQLINRINLSHQELYVGNVWEMGATALTLVGLFSCIALEAGLPWLVLALAGTQPLATLANGVVLFWARRPWIRPSLRAWSSELARQTVASGFWFLCMVIAYQVALNGSNIIIAQVMGSANVPEFGVPARLFGLVAMAAGLLIAPLWPAYAEALSREDYHWARRAYRRSLLVAASVAGTLALILVVVGKPLIQLWVGTSVAPSYFLLAALAGWTTSNAISDALATFLVGTQFIRSLALVRLLHAGVAIGLQIPLVSWLGVTGAALGLLIADLGLRLAPCLWLASRAQRQFGVNPNGSPR
jgi:O-antigen/teichoic acid export membrane protein